MRLVVFVGGLVSVSLLQAQTQHSTAAVKAAYVYNFLKFIEWPNEQNFESIRIGFLGGDDAYLEELLKIQDRGVRSKSIVVHAIKSYNDASQFQVIVVAADQNPQVGNINRSLFGTQTLLITDQADDKRQIMLNFTSPKDGSIGYEVNRYNMLQEKLTVSSDILVLGGTELEIAQLIRDMEKELYSSRQALNQQRLQLEQIENAVSLKEAQLNQQSDELKRLKNEVSEKEARIKGQSAELSRQAEAMVTTQKKLDAQQTQFSEREEELSKLRQELSSLDLTLEESRREIEESNRALAEKQQEIVDKEVFIKGLAEQIEQKQVKLSEQEQKIALQAEDLARQQESLDFQSLTLQTQSSTIQAQGKYLAAAVFGLVLVTFLIIIVLSFYRSAKKANAELNKANEQLEETNALLIDTQSQLVESEKMAALGGLVAGVAHEINTPLGVSVTAATHLSDAVENFDKHYQSGQLKRSELEDMLDSARESSAILTRNLERASHLIGNFKQVAADQTVEDLRDFEIGNYLEELCQSLSPQLKKGGHSITIKCKEHIAMRSYPGAIAQIVTNLVMNSLIHGFDKRRHGHIEIDVHQDAGVLTLTYSDDGMGITERQRGKIFEPFYTTKRAEGGTGLGMHICYNLVTQKLQGTISCEPSDKGAQFIVMIPTHLLST